MYYLYHVHYHRSIATNMLQPRPSYTITSPYPLPHTKSFFPYSLNIFTSIPAPPKYLHKLYTWEQRKQVYLCHIILQLVTVQNECFTLTLFTSLQAIWMPATVSKMLFDFLALLR